VPNFKVRNVLSKRREPLIAGHSVIFQRSLIRFMFFFIQV